MKFEGTGSLVRSEGTSHEQGVTNQSLRQTITCPRDIISCYETFVMDCDCNCDLVHNSTVSGEQINMMQFNHLIYSSGCGIE